MSAKLDRIGADLEKARKKRHDDEGYPNARTADGGRIFGEFPVTVQEETVSFKATPFLFRNVNSLLRKQVQSSIMLIKA